MIRNLHLKIICIPPIALPLHQLPEPVVLVVTALRLRLLAGELAVEPVVPAVVVEQGRAMADLDDGGVRMRAQLVVQAIRRVLVPDEVDLRPVLGVLALPVGVDVSFVVFNIVGGSHDLLMSGNGSEFWVCWIVARSGDCGEWRGLVHFTEGVCGTVNIVKL